MGCCYSNEKPTVYEVTLDNDGVAHHVEEGQGTHIIYVSENNETVLEKKVDSNHNKTVVSTPNPEIPTSISHHSSNQRIHPMDTNEKK